MYHQSPKKSRPTAFWCKNTDFGHRGCLLMELESYHQVWPLRPWPARQDQPHGKHRKQIKALSSAVTSPVGAGTFSTICSSFFNPNTSLGRKPKLLHWHPNQSSSISVTHALGSAAGQFINDLGMISNHYPKLDKRWPFEPRIQRAASTTKIAPHGQLANVKLHRVKSTCPVIVNQWKI